MDVSHAIGATLLLAAAFFSSRLLRLAFSFVQLQLHHHHHLYHDYKPDHCLWEIYQLLQKVILVGFLGFFNRGSFAQVVMGLFVTELVLLAFIK